MTTKAWTFTGRGSPQSVLAMTTAHPAPAFPPALPLPKAAPQPEEWVLVRTSFAGLNQGSLFYMGICPTYFRTAAAVPEMDFSGIVEDDWAPTATEGAPARFARGDRVAGYLPIGFMYPSGAGALQGLLACPARFVVPVPAAVRMEEAAGLMTCGGTATEMVKDARLARGQTVLVYGASGGVGTMAVQLAKLAVGAEGKVVGVCSGKNAEVVLGLGADEVRRRGQYLSSLWTAEMHSC
jgi:reticulon-4-interacting protein 1, mitochondrial